MGVNVAAHTRHVFLGSASPRSLIHFYAEVYYQLCSPYPIKAYLKTLLVS